MTETLAARPTTPPVTAKAFRFSGHESFACRYAWLPKAYRALRMDPALFSDEEGAMLELGIGKNMVRSLRFWVEAMGLVHEPALRSPGLVLTDFAHAIFAEDGFDPYLEDVRTQWLIHWKLSSAMERPLFAWSHLINDWPLPEFTRSEALAAFQRESRKMEGGHSEVTLGQHLDVFLHTYLPSRNKTVGVEDSLDGPLVDLNFLLPAGQRKGDLGRWEPVYVFRREAKPEITAALFDYCLMEFWNSKKEKTLTLRAATLGAGSPGQVFKLPEDDVRARLEEKGDRDYQTSYHYQPSAVQGLLSERKQAAPVTLEMVYGRKTAHG